MSDKFNTKNFPVSSKFYNSDLNFKELEKAFYETFSKNNETANSTVNQIYGINWLYENKTHYKLVLCLPKLIKEESVVNISENKITLKVVLNTDDEEDWKISTINQSPIKSMDLEFSFPENSLEKEGGSSFYESNLLTIIVPKKVKSSQIVIN